MRTERSGEKVWLEVAEIIDLLNEADKALNGDSNDAEHDALYSLRESLASYLDSPERRGKRA